MKYQLSLGDADLGEPAAARWQRSAGAALATHLLWLGFMLMVGFGAKSLAAVGPQTLAAQVLGIASITLGAVGMIVISVLTIRSTGARKRPPDNR